MVHSAIPLLKAVSAEEVGTPKRGVSGTRVAYVAFTGVFRAWV
jgi:hypothetical protein